MRWLELSVRSPQEFVEPLSQIFYRYGHGGVVVESEGGFNPDEGESASPDSWVTLKTYLPVNSTARERKARIDLGVRLVAHVSPISPLSEREIDEQEWQDSWKEHFDVLRVGRRLVVCPTWREHHPTATDIVLNLDPGMAFGTGHHPTTRACLELLEEQVRPGSKVLDVGCGSGILSIAAAKLGAGGVVGIEIDPVGVRVARANVSRNGVGHGVRVLRGTLPHPQVADGAYSIVVANISARVIAELAGDIVNALAAGGTLIASGVIEEHRPNVVEALTAEGARIERTVVDGDWVTMSASVGSISV